MIDGISRIIFFSQLEKWVFNNISMKLWALFDITQRFKTIRNFLKISCNLKLKFYQWTSVWGFIKTHLSVLYFEWNFKKKKIHDFLTSCIGPLEQFPRSCRTYKCLTHVVIQYQNIIFINTSLMSLKNLHRGEGFEAHGSRKKLSKIQVSGQSLYLSSHK